jgi:hypothetical protein
MDSVLFRISYGAMFCESEKKPRHPNGCAGLNILLNSKAYRPAPAAILSNTISPLTST